MTAFRLPSRLPSHLPSPPPAPSRVRRSGLSGAGAVLLAASAVVLATATTAAAHAEVTASDPRALARDVTLEFTSEAESAEAGIAKLRVVLPEGIPVDAVSLKSAPKGWKFTRTEDGYDLAGTALATGTDAEHSVTVKQLPDAKTLAFKTIETYGDGEVSRWIELPRAGEEKPDNIAPILELKPAAEGATPIDQGAGPSASPSPSVTASAPSPTATPAEDGADDGAAAADGNGTEGAEAAADDGDNAANLTGLLVGLVAAVVVLGIGALLWLKRRGRPGTE
ncbi:DUF1775 domain-containing protein [Streptomyces sp. NPDC056987]|uniref:DUF1775 domain-containing protein n=1 Tax=Streptomyces sp. NPDC056987 TaxID=3345988 RepID=UPI00363F9BE1